MSETTTTVTAPRFFFVKDAPARTGYSQKAVRKKIETGVWLEGHEYRRAPDNRIVIDMEGFEKWVKGERRLVRSS
ncbi:hypothetical protein os1_06410 [Comamonadaceae bacterium OS-1]|nr:hypothetical protein os1_06410 [Comamonadaceae bacterium OS-1]